MIVLMMDGSGGCGDLLEESFEVLVGVECFCW